MDVNPVGAALTRPNTENRSHIVPVHSDGVQASADAGRLPADRDIGVGAAQGSGDRQPRRSKRIAGTTTADAYAAPPFHSVGPVQKSVASGDDEQDHDRYNLRNRQPPARLSLDRGLDDDQDFTLQLLPEPGTATNAATKRNTPLPVVIGDKNAIIDFKAVPFDEEKYSSPDDLPLAYEGEGDAHGEFPSKPVGRPPVDNQRSFPAKEFVEPMFATDVDQTAILDGFRVLKEEMEGDTPAETYSLPYVRAGQTEFVNDGSTTSVLLHLGKINLMWVHTERIIDNEAGERVRVWAGWDLLFSYYMKNTFVGPQGRLDFLRRIVKNEPAGDPHLGLHKIDDYENMASQFLPLQKH